MKKIALGIVLIFANVYVMSQDSLRWNQSQKLSWSDFKGIPDTSSALRSLVVCTLPYHYHKQDSTFTFTINCFFLKKSSWSKPPPDSNIIGHAQGHFDIAEICAEKIRRRLAGFAVSSKDWKQQMTEIIHEAFNEKDLMNERYDRETENGNNQAVQNRWNSILLASLKEQ